MNYQSASFQKSTALTKMQQRYWETKQALKKTLGNKEDSCFISSDAEMDVKLELLVAADESFLSLLNAINDYQQRLGNLIKAEDNFGIALHNFGLKDTSEAGKLMCHIGKALNCSSKQKDPLRLPLLKLHHNVETFHCRAVSDAYNTVEYMEKARTSYRSSLMWMKTASEKLDPENTRKLKKFKKVQDHVKNLKIRFDRLKLETMQKVDLLLFSRCNLFSQTLVLYQSAFCKMSKHVTKALDSVIVTLPYYSHYTFQAVKELNVYSVKPRHNMFPGKMLVPTRTNMFCAKNGPESEACTGRGNVYNNENCVGNIPCLELSGNVTKLQCDDMSLIELNPNSEGDSKKRFPNSQAELPCQLYKNKTMQEIFNLGEESRFLNHHSLIGDARILKPLNGNGYCDQSRRFVNGDWKKELDYEFQSTLELFDPLFENGTQATKDRHSDPEESLFDLTISSSNFDQQKEYSEISLLEEEPIKADAFKTLLSWDWEKVSAELDPFDDIFSKHNVSKAGEHC